MTLTQVEEVYKALSNGTPVAQFLKTRPDIKENGRQVINALRATYGEDVIKPSLEAVSLETQVNRVHDNIKKVLSGPKSKKKPAKKALKKALKKTIKEA